MQWYADNDFKLWAKLSKMQITAGLKKPQTGDDI